MDVHVATESHVKEALLQSAQLFGFNLEHESPETTDIVIIDSKQELLSLYSDSQHFIVVSTERPKTLPDNAVWCHVNESVAKITQHLSDLKKQIGKRAGAAKPELETATVYEPREAKESALRILVIDDSRDNLRQAIELLNKQHYITLAQGYGEGAKLIEENEYDVVLSDCRMPIDTYHSALSVEEISLDETVHNGPYLMFKATKRGARFAVVTDANHHHDWASAIFDDLRDPQTVNGQPVLFINYMQKRWDKALEKLLSL